MRACRWTSGADLRNESLRAYRHHPGVSTAAAQKRGRPDREPLEHSWLHHLPRDAGLADLRQRILPAYDVSKSAVNAFTVHLAYELKDTKIRVNAAHPGWVKTEMGGEGATMESWTAPRPASLSLRRARTARTAPSCTWASPCPGKRRERAAPSREFGSRAPPPTERRAPVTTNCASPIRARSRRSLIASRPAWLTFAFNMGNGARVAARASSSRAMDLF